MSILTSSEVVRKYDPDDASVAYSAVKKSATWTVKAGLAQMLKGGLIMDVIDREQALIAEAAGAVAVMALERVPADIRAWRRAIGAAAFT